MYSQWLLQAWNFLLVISSAILLAANYLYFTFKSNGNHAKRIAQRQNFARNQRFKLRQELTTTEENGQKILISEQRRSILSLSARDLLAKLKVGELKPLEVLEAYQASALEATESKNCICLFITEAKKWAKELESIPIESRGPLYGLPLSIKECFDIKGYDRTIGLSKLINDPAKEDGSMVQRMKQLGAVPFCHTNISQLMKTFGSSNPIYGVTLNPYDDTRTAGGSSSGEACLLAMGGSILGVGTDVGGSVRIPSNFCGTVALKPTNGRLPECGRRASTKGKYIGLHSNSGFMASSVDAVTLGMRALLQDPEALTKLDGLLFPLPWNESMFSTSRKLRIGWYDDSNGVEPTPGCKRAVHEAIQLLKEDGHEVLKIDSTPFYQGSVLYFHHILADEGANTAPLINDEILDKDLKLLRILSKTPRWIKKTFLYYLTYMTSPLTASMISHGKHQTKDLWISTEELNQLRSDIIRDWNKKNIDVVIAPGFVAPALTNDVVARILPGCHITAAFNALDFPVGAMPITKESKEDQVKLTQYPANRPSAKDSVYDLIRSSTKGAEGLPLGIQVIGRPWQEEMVLNVMTEVERLRDVKKLFRPFTLS